MLLIKWDIRLITKFSKGQLNLRLPNPINNRWSDDRKGYASRLETIHGKFTTNCLFHVRFAKWNLIFI